MTSFAGFPMNRIAKGGAIALLLAIVALLSPIHAHAQGVTRVCTELIGANGSNNCTDVSATNPFPVTGSFTYPGTAGVATGGTTTAGTMPYVNAYIVNGSSGGTSSTFGSAFPATGTAIGLTNGTNMVAWSATTTYGTAPAAIAVPAVNASVTASALPTGAATSALQTTGNTTLTTINTTLGTPFQAGAALAANQSVNTAQVNGVTTLTGAGATGTGAQRVTVSQDATTIAGAPPGRTYNTIAASQTSQILSSTNGGTTGTAGDYLSHCVIVPATTSPGNVIIYDNATAIYTFTGGTSSVTTLISWPVPVGAISTSGGWKVTTGANVSAFCSGKFT